MKSILSGCVVGLGALFAIAVDAQAQNVSRDEMVLRDRDALVDDDFWIYDDFEEAVDQAIRESKPIMVVLRCIP